MALQLQQQQQQQLNQQPNTQLRQRSPGAVSAAVAGLCTAADFTTPKAPRQRSSGISPQRITPRSSSSQRTKSAEQAMGVLRNGKPYSPCGKGAEAEKRRLSLSSEKEFPNAKRRDPGRQQPTVLMRSLSSSNLHSAGNTCVSVDTTMSSFMTRMEELVTTTLSQMKSENADLMREVKTESEKIKSVADNTLKEIKSEGEKYMAEVKLESSKLTEGLSSLRKAADEHDKSLSSLKKNLATVEKDLTACFEDTKLTVQTQGERLTEIETKLEAAPETSLDIEERIRKLEQIAADIGTKLDNMSVDGEADLYPVRRSIVAMQVWINSDETPQSVAELVINDVLNLREVKVVRAETVDTYPDGNCTIKILLDSAASVKAVLEAKIALGSCDNKNIRSIWIQRSKTNEQRMLERNCALLLREVDKVGKFRQNGQGRIVRNSKKNNPVEVGSQESIPESVTGAGDHPTFDTTHVRGGYSGHGGPGRGGRRRGGGRSRKTNPQRQGGTGPHRFAAPGSEASGTRREQPKLQLSRRALEALSRDHHGNGGSGEDTMDAETF